MTELIIVGQVVRNSFSKRSDNYSLPYPLREASQTRGAVRIGRAKNGDRNICRLYNAKWFQGSERRFR